MASPGKLSGTPESSTRSAEVSTIMGLMREPAGGFFPQDVFGEEDFSGDAPGPPVLRRARALRAQFLPGRDGDSLLATSRPLVPGITTSVTMRNIDHNPVAGAIGPRRP
jgi:hypothetical protein